MQESAQKGANELQERSAAQQGRIDFVNAEERKVSRDRPAPAAVKRAPLRVMDWPPAVPPFAGEIAVIVGSVRETQQRESEAMNACREQCANRCNPVPASFRTVRKAMKETRLTR